jgi:hypothetical protein
MLHGEGVSEKWKNTFLASLKCFLAELEKCFLNRFQDGFGRFVCWRCPWACTGFNFINILLSTFSYESALRSFSLITVWLCNFFGKRLSVQKLLVKCWWNWLLQEARLKTVVDDSGIKVQFCYLKFWKSD